MPIEKHRARRGIRICMLTSDHSAFDGRIFHKEAVSLRRRYAQVWVMAPGEGGAVVKQGVEVLPLRRPKGALGVLRMLLEMTRRGSRLQADVYHCHELESLWVAGRIAARGGAKLVYDAHEFYADRFAERLPVWMRPPARFALNVGERVLCRNADHVVTVSEELAAKFGGWGHRVAVVENLALEVGSPEGSPPIQRGNEETIGIYVGGLYRERGILEIVKAISIARSRGVNVKLLLIGPSFGGFADEVRRRAAGLGIERFVELVGRVPFDEVFGYLRQADFGLVTDYPEPRNLNSVCVKLFEYMQAGLPVVANDLPAMARIIREAQCGLLTSSVRPNDIAEAIVRLLSDDGSMRKMGQNGRGAFLDKYQWKLAEERLLGTYDQLGREP